MHYLLPTLQRANPLLSVDCYSSGKVGHSKWSALRQFIDSFDNLNYLELVVPERLRVEILQSFHEGITGDRINHFIYSRHVFTDQASAVMHEIGSDLCHLCFLEVPLTINKVGIGNNICCLSNGF